MAQPKVLNPLLREWAPLTELFEKLPTKTGGLFSQDIRLTCIDVLSEVLVLGTNVGIIFWFDRKKKDLQRMRCENPDTHITVVKAVSTVDYMVASGNQSGAITIFQIPKPVPESLPESLKPQLKQIERYTVTDLHKSPITTLEWSKNGMKLFSGDKTGSVILTEIDFYMHVCKSMEILNETYEIVQLSYRQQHLLISTTFRSIICHYVNKWKVCQVGKKDRKVLGKFGGIINQKGFNPNNIILYCMRPGLRIWIADVEGEVQKTLLFKDLLCKDCPQVPLLNPISKTLQQMKPQKEASFGVVQQFCDNLLITYNNDIIYVLNPENMSILATINNLRSILDVATNNDELFILEDGRSLLRISYQPEYSTDMVDDSLVACAEEAQEIPKSSLKTFDEISKEDFDDSILFKKTKKKTTKEREPKMNNKLPLNNEDQSVLNCTKPTLMNLSMVGVLLDLRSPDSIVNDIKQKEKILSDVLNLQELTFDVDHSKDCAISEPPSIEQFVSISNIPENVIEKPKAKSPVFVPNDWKISNIQVTNQEYKEPVAKKVPSSAPIPIVRKEKRNSSTHDSSFSDWEIV
ncbi:hypothetical protein ABEB36_000733 [Hypothenemus hampei]|uniref:HPS5-like beta-propeller domain-containing protein n=1 Tax=Hypothenemus hampei TaxID=57062 RepID=A0ABD1FCA2_HYPHA